MCIDAEQHRAEDDEVEQRLAKQSFHAAQRV
jgi:hypothetical protein